MLWKLNLCCKLKASETIFNRPTAPYFTKQFDLLLYFRPYDENSGRCIGSSDSRWIMCQQLTMFGNLFFEILTQSKRYTSMSLCVDSTSFTLFEIYSFFSLFYLIQFGRCWNVWSYIDIRIHAFSINPTHGEFIELLPIFGVDGMKRMWKMLRQTCFK